MLQGIGYVTAAEKIQLHRFFPPENTNTYQELMQLRFFALFQTKVKCRQHESKDSWKVRGECIQVLLLGY